MEAEKCQCKDIRRRIRQKESGKLRKRPWMSQKCNRARYVMKVDSHSYVIITALISLTPSLTAETGIFGPCYRLRWGATDPCTMSHGTFIPCSVLTLASDWLIAIYLTFDVIGVRERNIIGDVTMAITAAVHFPCRCDATEQYRVYTMVWAR